MANSNKIVLYPKCLPTLTEGEYTLTVKQTLVVNSSSETYENTSKYKVESSGYNIDQLIIEMFPPPNSEGKYNDAIPQIVLNNKSFPWEKEINGDEKAPWLALLLLSGKEEFSIQRKSVIQNSATSEDEGINELSFLSLKKELLISILPKIKERHFLAHVREVPLSLSQSTAHKEKLTASSPEKEHPKLSVIIGNRLPETGINTAVLVSLEKVDSCLSDTTNTSENIELIALKHWQFTSNGSEEGFKNYLEKKVDAAPYRLKTDATEIIDPEIINLIDAGFVPLKQDQFEGEDDPVIMYRGPLMPYKENSNLAVKSNATDKATAKSYTIARQLGRLMCLRDKNIADNVINNRTQNIRDLFDIKHREELTKSIGEDQANIHVGNTYEIPLSMTNILLKGMKGVLESTGTNLDKDED